MTVTTPVSPGRPTDHDEQFNPLQAMELFFLKLAGKHIYLPSQNLQVLVLEFIGFWVPVEIHQGMMAIMYSNTVTMIRYSFHHYNVWLDGYSTN